MTTPYMRGWHYALKDWDWLETTPPEDDLDAEEYASHCVDAADDRPWDELVEEGRGYAAAVKMKRSSKITGGGANLNGFGR